MSWSISSPEGGTSVLIPGPHTFGRGVCDVQVADELVSSTHAIFHVVPNPPESSLAHAQIHLAFDASVGVSTCAGSKCSALKKEIPSPLQQTAETWQFDGRDGAALPWRWRFTVKPMPLVVESLPGRKMSLNGVDLQNAESPGRRVSAALVRLLGQADAARRFCRLQNGDVLRVGTTDLRAAFQPLWYSTSGVHSVKSQLLAAASRAGVYLHFSSPMPSRDDASPVTSPCASVRYLCCDWDSSAAGLIAGELAVTPKMLRCLVAELPVLSPSYLLEFPTGGAMKDLPPSDAHLLARRHSTAGRASGDALKRALLPSASLKGVRCSMLRRRVVLFQCAKLYGQFAEICYEAGGVAALLRQRGDEEGAAEATCDTIVAATPMGVPPEPIRDVEVCVVENAPGDGTQLPTADSAASQAVTAPRMLHSLLVAALSRVLECATEHRTAEAEGRVKVGKCWNPHWHSWWPRHPRDTRITVVSAKALGKSLLLAHWQGTAASVPLSPSRALQDASPNLPSPADARTHQHLKMKSHSPLAIKVEKDVDCSSDPASSDVPKPPGRKKFDPLSPWVDDVELDPLHVVEPYAPVSSASAEVARGSFKRLLVPSSPPLLDERHGSKRARTYASQLDEMLMATPEAVAVEDGPATEADAQEKAQDNVKSQGVSPAAAQRAESEQRSLWLSRISRPPDDGVVVVARVERAVPAEHANDPQAATSLELPRGAAAGKTFQKCRSQLGAASGAGVRVLVYDETAR